MKDVFTPFVYWAQDKDYVFLKVDLQDVEDTNIQIQKQGVLFEGVGEGARGRNHYKFQMDLFGEADVQKSNYTVGKRCVDLKIVKQKSKRSSDDEPTDWWPRLVSSRNRPTWLRLDFDRWKDPPGYEDDDIPSLNGNANDILRQMENFDYMDGESQEAAVERMVKTLTKDLKAGPSMRTIYLVLYNFLLTLGFLGILGQMAYRFAMDRTDFFPHTWSDIGPKYICCQAAQWLEALHAFFGFVPGSVLFPCIQHSCRSFVLFLLYMEEGLQDKPFVFYLFLIWGLNDIVNYSYSLLNTVKNENALLTWLRYSLWILLYPLGIVVEGIIMLRAIPLFYESGRLSTSLAGISLQFPLVIHGCILFLLVPGGFYLMYEMLKQRKQVIGPSSGSPRRKKVR